MTDGRDGPEDDGRPQDNRESDREEPLGDLAAEVRERASETGSPSERADRSGREGPLADVAAAVDERRNRKRDEADAFESVEVGDLDGERLWEQLATGEDGPTVAVPPEQAADAADRDVRTIPKATCHGCPHFGDPPQLACTREGTDILAMVDTEQFRVADCPMVVDGEEDIGGIADGTDAPHDGDGNG